jgi:hypothetical protein
MSPRVALLAAVAVSLPLAAAPAQQSGRSPDWPCMQRLVPELTAGTFWSGPPAPAGADWRADSRIADLVAAVANRDLPVDEGEAKLAAFADSVPAEQRGTVLPELFAGLVDAINGDRHDVIVRLEELGRRQKSMAGTVDKVTDELRAVPVDATGDDAARRQEIEQRRNFLIRSYQQVQRTIQYACQVPADLEARLGRYARALAAKLPPAQQ